jgi:hypothetical protein
MKKVLISLVILAVCFTAFADTSASSANLSADAINNFASQALYIQTETDTSVYTNLWNYSAHGYSNPIDFYFNGPSYVYTETRIDWTPYQGTTPISKDQFYNLVGRQDLAAQYLSFKHARKTWSNVTVGSLVAGAALAVGGALTEGTMSECLFLASAISFTTSCVGLFVLDVILIEEDTFSVSFAMNAAQTYNVSLLATVATN